MDIHVEYIIQIKEGVLMPLLTTGLFIHYW